MRNFLYNQKSFYLEELKKDELELFKGFASKIRILNEGEFLDVLVEIEEEKIIGLDERIELFKEMKECYYNYTSIPPAIKIGNKVFNFENSYIMAILNVTPDSFYDGGKYFDEEKAKKRIDQCISEGADIIDIGGESTRPGSIRISEDEEIRRVIPLIKYTSKNYDVPISIDTYKSKVAEEAIASGADMVNDISGLIADERMSEIVAKYDVPIVLMHIRGNPRIMQINVNYEDVVKDISRSLRTKIEYATLKGIKKEKIIIDPGIGFGKRVEDNLSIIKRLDEFKSIGRPILIGISRKSFIGKILDLPVEERLEGSLALLAIALLKGANIARVHDVKESKRVAKIIDHLKNL